MPCMPLFSRQKCRVSLSLTPMSSAGKSKLPAQILPKKLKLLDDVVVPADFSRDEILELKKWMRINGDQNSGYEAVYYSAWNGKPTLPVTEVPKSDVYKVKVKPENVEVNLEHPRVKLE